MPWPDRRLKRPHDPETGVGLVPPARPPQAGPACHRLLDHRVDPRSDGKHKPPSNGRVQRPLQPGAGSCQRQHGLNTLRLGARRHAGLSHARVLTNRLYSQSKGSCITGKASPCAIQLVFLVWLHICPTSVDVPRMACAETGEDERETIPQSACPSRQGGSVSSPLAGGLKGAIADEQNRQHNHFNHHRGWGSRGHAIER